jgi:hypothetical protein
LQPVFAQSDGSSSNSTNPSSSADSGSSSNSSSSNTGAIVGGVVGGIAALVLLVLLLLYLRRKRAAKEKPKTLSTAGNGNASGTNSTKSTFTKQSAAVALAKVSSLGRKEGSFRAGEIFTNNGASDSAAPGIARLDSAERGANTDSADNRTGTTESADYGEWLKTARWEGINLINDISSDSLAERLESIPGLGPLHLNPGDLSIDVDESGDYLLLGRGSAGSVFRGTLRGVQPVAGKILLYPGMEAEKAFLKEAAILQRVSRDRNIVQLYGIGAVKDKMVLVMELMEGGDLRNALDSDKDGVLHWQRGGKNVALDIARGLTALHSCKVIHRDLKSKNVLLTSFGSGNNNFTAKLGDVGVAANLTHSYLSNSMKVVGTLAWSAPELLLGRRCDEKVDVYSLGVILSELATGEMPRRGEIYIPEVSERCPKELAELIAQCTQEEPRARPSAKEVYERILKI